MVGNQSVSAVIILAFSLITSSTHLLNISPASVEGRLLVEEMRESKSSIIIGKEEKVTLRGRMGSRPPRCEEKCRNCGHCEAIQVPTTTTSSSSSTITSRSSVAYARGDGYSDYKPMSWKCKCGSSIFNP